MKILMVTNTFTPHVNGVARSVENLTERFRELGHRVLVAAPELEGNPAEERDIIRLPALQKYNGSDLSVPFPMTARLRQAVSELAPEIVHSHHPFLLGDAALRVAASRNIPIVFTHHTMYELCTHYVPEQSPRIRRLALDLATGYANLCDAVIAPSASIAEILKARKVRVPIEVIPRGIDCEPFACGDGAAFRARHGIAADAFVVGHVGRLAPEKNIEFLARALARFASEAPAAHILIVGAGPGVGIIDAEFSRCGLLAQLHRTGAIAHASLPDAYGAQDVFAFASKSETQSLTLAEAMASGVPAVAIDAPGVREIVRDRENGRLLPSEDQEAFCAALHWAAELKDLEREKLERCCQEMARHFSIENTADRTLDLYHRMIQEPHPPHVRSDQAPWCIARRRLAREWEAMENRTSAARRNWGTGSSSQRPI